MADFENNVRHLATVRTNERDRRTAREVAEDLIHSLLEKSWFDLSDRRKQSLVNSSSNRIWDSYMGKKNRGYSSEEAAREAMLEELSLLKQQFTQGK